MWRTERLIGEKWSTIARWGNVDNAIDSASYLADLCKIRTRVVEVFSSAIVWDSVDGRVGTEGAEELTPEELAQEWAHENANATFPAEVPTQAPVEEYRVITNVGAHPIHTSTYTSLADARACLKARRVNCPGAGTYHFILDSEGYIVPLIPLKPSP